MRTAVKWLLLAAVVGVAFDLGRQHSLRQVPRTTPYAVCSAERADGTVKCPPTHSRPVLAVWGDVVAVGFYQNGLWFVVGEPGLFRGRPLISPTPPDDWREIEVQA